LRLLLVTGIALVGASSRAQDAPDKLPQRPPKPITPPHRPVQQGFRFTATFGFNFLMNGNYSYNTSVTTPSGNTFNYSDMQRSAGGTMSLGAAMTPGGSFRRVTFGFDLNFGGLSVAGHSVIPPGSNPPFSQDNLNTQITRATLVGSHWHPFVAPYIEHDIGSIFDNRVRLGYEYFRTSGSADGLFPIGPSRTLLGSYSVHFSQNSHLVRLAVHNDTWLDDSDIDHAPPPRRRSGVVQEGGLLVGTDGSVVVFVRVGPVWTF